MKKINLVSAVVLILVLVIFFLYKPSESGITNIAENKQNKENLEDKSAGKVVDLKIASLIVEPSEPQENADVSFDIFIGNAGDADAENSLLTIDFRDGTPAIQESIVKISPGETVEHTLTHVFDFAAVYEVVVTIENTEENNPSDNSLSRQINVLVAEKNKTVSEEDVASQAVAGVSHTECIQNQCVVVDSPGENQCSSNANCTGEITVDT